MKSKVLKQIINLIDACNECKQYGDEYEIVTDEFDKGQYAIYIKYKILYCDDMKKLFDIVQKYNLIIFSAVSEGTNKAYIYMQ